MRKSKSKNACFGGHSNYMSKEKIRILMNAFFTSQFGYSPLLWIFHSRTLNNRINKLQGKTLCLVCNE